MTIIVKFCKKCGSLAPLGASEGQVCVLCGGEMAEGLCEEQETRHNLIKELVWRQDGQVFVLRGADNLQEDENKDEKVLQRAL